MAIVSVNHIQLGFPSGGHSRMRHFYGDVLGLNELLQGNGSTLRFKAGSQRIDLVPSAQWQPPSDGIHLAFEVRNLPGLHALLQHEGLAVDEPAPHNGYRKLHVKDPAGNALELLEPDFSPVVFL